MLPIIAAALLAVSAPIIVAAQEVPRLDVPSPPARIIVAQGEVTIPSDSQLERMEERAITTNPLDDSEARLRGGEAAENRQMDRRAHRIDEQLLNGGGICAGCR
jgi:hypothetical protein